MAIIGYNGATDCEFAPGHTWSANKFTASMTGTIDSIFYYYYQTGSGKFISVGIYSDNAGSPGTCLNHSSSVGSKNSAYPFEWKEIAIPETSITSGTDYWLVAQTDAYYAGYYEEGKTGSYDNKYIANHSASYPDWSTNPSGLSDATHTIAIYATIAESEAYTATFTEQNSLDDVEVSIYSNSGRTTEVAGSPITTAGGGVATLDLVNGTYYYTASKFGYDDLEDSFTIADAIEAVDFTLVASTVDLYPKLEWLTTNPDIQKTPALEWLTKQDDIQKTPSLDWLAKPEHRFCPNLINYEFDFLTPTIYSSKNTATVSGILHSLTLNMKNTGSSGSTIIELYDDNVLITTKTITADNDEYNDVEYFDMKELIYPEDTLEVKVIQVAVGCSDLKIGVFEMTFPFAVEKAFIGNIKDSTEIVSINRDYLFNNADYWTIDFNQPLNSVASVTGENVNGDTVNLTSELIDGDFYNSRIKVTPSVLSNIEKLSIKAKDLNNKNYSFIFYPTAKNYMAEYPFYVYADEEEIEIFTPATYYKYSFDSGVTWSDWSTVSSTDTMTIDFSSQTAGLKTLTVRYRNSSTEFEEDVEIYYIQGEISCAINYVEKDAKLSYTDAVPLDRVEVYYDDILTDTLELSIITGMDTVTLDTSAKTLTVNAGYVYADNRTYYFDGAVVTIDPDFTEFENNGWRYILVFNTSTKLFEWKEEILTLTSDAKDAVAYTGYIVIAIADFFTAVTIIDNLVSSWIITNTCETYSNISNWNRFSLNLDEDSVIKIRVIDVAGRERDFSVTYTLTKFNIWRELTVSRGNVYANSYEGTHYPKNIVLTTGADIVWRSDGALPAWNRFDCGLDSKKTLKEYSVTCGYVTDDGVPKTWKLQGSNDADTWTDLHEVTDETSWTNYSSKTYTVTNTTAYAFYRIYVTAVVAGTYVEIYLLQLRETVAGTNFAVYVEEEILPGQIHQSNELELDIETEDWTLDDTNGES